VFVLDVNSSHIQAFRCGVAHLTSLDADALCSCFVVCMHACPCRRRALLMRPAIARTEELPAR
jgi:hypothetical protein